MQHSNTHVHISSTVNFICKKKGENGNRIDLTSQGKLSRNREKRVRGDRQTVHRTQWSREGHTT